MSCSIDSYDNYAHNCSFYSDKILIAKKDHKCIECGDIIKKGYSYERVTGKWDDKFHHYDTCMICKEIRDKIFCSFVFGEIWSDLSEYTSHGETLDYDMLDGLSISAIDKI